MALLAWFITVLVDNPPILSKDYLFENCKVEFFVRAEGKEPSRLDLVICSRNLKNNQYLNQPSEKFLLQPGKIYRIQKSVDLRDFPEEFKNACPIIQVNGCVTIDQFSIVPKKDNRN